MGPVQTVFYDHVIQHGLEGCYGETDYYRRLRKRDELSRQLWEQLPPEQRELLEEVQRAYDWTQNAELEAMFLAVFRQTLSLLGRG